MSFNAVNLQKSFQVPKKCRDISPNSLLLGVLNALKKWSGSSVGACGRVSGCLFFIFKSYASHLECLWSGLRLPLLYLRIICLPAWAPLVGSSAALALSPSLGAWSGLRLPLYLYPNMCFPAGVGFLAASALVKHWFLMMGASGQASACFYICLQAFVFGSRRFVPPAVSAFSGNLSPNICRAAWAPVIGLLASLVGCPGFVSQHVPFSLGASGHVTAALALPPHLFPNFRLALFLPRFLPIPFLCLPAWVPLVGSPAAFCRRFPCLLSFLVSHHLAFRALSPISLLSFILSSMRLYSLTLSPLI